MIKCPNLMHLRRVLLCTVFSCCFAGFASCQVITTVAGTDWSFPPGNLAALDAPLGIVTGVAVDARQNLYVSDSRNHLVLRITPTGVLNVVAGNGSLGFSGDGGPATSASLDTPAGLTVDAGGNLYIADSVNQRIRKVSNQGIITTVAGGNGARGFSGDGGPATSASLLFPNDVAVDTAGNLYIADTGNDRVRKVSPAGTITTAAGKGLSESSGDGGRAVDAALLRPTGLALDGAGNLFIATSDRVRKVAPNGLITTVAGGGVNSGDGGPATGAGLHPWSVAADPTGNLYIVESDYSRVRKVAPSGTITTVAGSSISGGFSGDGGPAASAEMNLPRGVVVDAAGNIHIGDNGRIRRVTPAGIIDSIAGNGDYRFSGDGGPAISAALLTSNPPLFLYASSAAVDPEGNLNFPDMFNNRVRRITPDGTIATFAGNGTSSSATSVGDGGPAGSATVGLPTGVAVDRSGNLYIPQFRGVRKVSPDGMIATYTSAVYPRGVALDAADNLYVAYDRFVSRIAPDGTATIVAGNGVLGFSGDGGPATDASFSATGLAVDTAGNLFIADAGNNRIRKVSTDGIVTTVAGNGRPGFSGDGGPAIDAALTYPSGVSVDAGENLYIADTANHRIRKLTPEGIITTVAGSGAVGYSGDGGPAAKAALFYPSWVLADAAGNLLIGDAGNNRVRKVLAAKPSFSLDRARLDFTGVAGGARAPAQSLSLSASVTGLTFTATASDPWMSVTPVTGTMAASLQVTVDPSQLAAGVYGGSVTVSAPLADPPTQTVSVAFSVTPSNPPRLSVNPDALSLSLPQQSVPVEKSVFVANAGSGSLTFRASASGGNWLRVSVGNDTARPAAPGSMNVIADPGGLTAGAYDGAVTVTSSATGETVTIPVAFTVTAANRPSILLSQTGLSFRSVANNCSSAAANCSDDLPQCFAVLNGGQGTLDFSVTADVPWLQVGRATCPYRAVSSSATPPPEVVALLHAGNLAPGSYEGRIRVTAPQADNSPQTVLVKVTVVSSATSLGPIVRPTGLVFAGPQAQTPGSLDVYIYNLAQQSFHYASSPVFVEGDGWFSYAPSIGDVKQSQQAGVLKVYPNFVNLAGGTYHGGITVATAYALQPVEVLAAVSGGTGPTSARAAAGCLPARLNGVFTLVPQEFNAPVGQPFPIELYFSDDCGAPLTSGSVVASFSNGDGGINLTPLRDGRWAGTWTPQRAAVGNRVQITIRATGGGGGLTADLQRSGGLQ